MEDAVWYNVCEMEKKICSIKRVICIFLAVITTLMLCVSAAAHDEELVVLSELSDEELLAFLEESGVDIPSAYVVHINLLSCKVKIPMLWLSRFVEEENR